MDRRPQKGRGRRRLKWGLRALGLLIWVASAILWYVWHEAQDIVDEFHAGPKKEVVEQAAPQLNVEPRHKAPGIKKATTYLLIGSDVRPTADSGARSDTIMLVRVFPGQHAASILSLPRDLWVPLADGYGENRINAAYSYAGVGGLIKTIREWLGVEINHFILTDFTSFIKVVDDLNGVYMPIDGYYHHENDGTSEAENWSSISLDPGYQRLMGEDALSYVRFRHLDSDFYRAARQQIFLRELGRELKDHTGDVFTLREIIKAIAEGTASDIDSVAETLKLADTLRQIPSQNVVRVTMQANEAVIDGMDVLVPTEADKEEALKAWADPHLTIARQKKRPKVTWPAPERSGEALAPVIGLGHLNLEAITATIRQANRAKALTKARKEAVRHVKHPQKAADILVGATPPALLTRPQKIRICTPQELPEGFSWPPTEEEPARAYTLAHHPAIAAWATAGSGNSILWMWTNWADPPILTSPEDAVRIDGKKYLLWWESGKLHQVAWSLGRTVVWITNTLLNDLSSKEMLALATSSDLEPEAVEHTHCPVVLWRVEQPLERLDHSSDPIWGFGGVRRHGASGDLEGAAEGMCLVAILSQVGVERGDGARVSLSSSPRTHNRLVAEEALRSIVRTSGRDAGRHVWSDGATARGDSCS